MSQKNKSRPARGVIAAVSPVVSLSAFDKQEQEALAVLETIRTGRAAAQAKKTADLAAFLNTLPGAILAITGGDTAPTVDSIISMLEQNANGTLGQEVKAKGTNHGQHAKRLDAEEEGKVRAFFIERATAEAMGQPLPVISTFCAGMNISGQTYDVRRKRYLADAEVTAEIGEKVKALKAAQPAPAVAAV